MAIPSPSRRKASALSWMLKVCSQLLLLLATLVHPTQSAVLSTFTACDGSEYTSPSNASTFEAAVALCKAHGLGWSLAVISSAGDQSCLQTVGAGKTIWLALNTVNTISSWLNDRALVLNNFATGGRPGNHCTVANTTIAVSQPNWFATACSSRHDFLCQKSSTPTSAPPTSPNLLDFSNMYTVALVSVVSALVVLVTVLSYCLYKARPGVVSDVNMAYKKPPIDICSPIRESPSPIAKKMSKMSVQKQLSEQWSKEEPIPEPPADALDAPAESAEETEEAEYVMSDWEEAPFYRHQSEDLSNGHVPAQPQKSTDRYKQSVPNTYDNLAPVGVPPDVFANTRTEHTRSVLSFVRVNDGSSATSDMSTSDALTAVAASSEKLSQHSAMTPECEDESSTLCPKRSTSRASREPDAISDNTMLENDDNSSVGFSTIAQRHSNSATRKNDLLVAVGAGAAVENGSFKIGRSIDEGSPNACTTDSDMSIPTSIKNGALTVTPAPVSVPTSSAVADTGGASRSSLLQPESSKLLDEATLALDSLNEQLDIFCDTASLDSVSQTSDHSSEAGTLADERKADRDVENAVAVLDQLDLALDDFLD